MGHEATLKFDEFTDVTIYETLTQLQIRHSQFVKRNMKDYTISDIYESPISYSFRVFNNKTHITEQFHQHLKD